MTAAGACADRATCRHSGAVLSSTCRGISPRIRSSFAFPGVPAHGSTAGSTPVTLPWRPARRCPSPNLPKAAIIRIDQAAPGGFVRVSLESPAETEGRRKRVSCKCAGHWTTSWSGRRDSNPRPPPWQGCRAGPLNCGVAATRPVSWTSSFACNGVVLGRFAVIHGTPTGPLRRHPRSSHQVGHAFREARLRDEATTWPWSSDSVGP